MAVAPWQACYGSPDTAVSDLWDMPHTLGSICDGQRTLIFMCNPDKSTCREGAVYFDSQAARIQGKLIRPICLFTGNPEDVRNHALALDLGVPVYIDSEDRAYEALLDQKVLPAMVLLDEGGNVTRTIYGGGQSLDNNLGIILKEQGWLSRRTLILTAIPLAVVAALLLIR
jgi:hypothetical protein